jgi:hypothetical protein
VVRLAQVLIVRIRTNTEQIIMCSHRYAFGGAACKERCGRKRTRFLARQWVAAKPISLGDIVLGRRSLR